MSRNRSIFGVVALIAALMAGCSLRTDESTDPAAVSVTFTDEATAGEMAAFFEGFNAGSFAGRVETRALTLDTDQRRMEITFESSKEADSFIVMAEQADAIEQVAKHSEK
jgi:hypothetical protein